MYRPPARRGAPRCRARRAAAAGTRPALWRRPSLSLSLFLSISLSVYLYIYIYLYISLSIHIYIYIYIYLSISLSLSLSLYLSLYLYVCVYIYIYIHIYICLSIYLLGLGVPLREAPRGGGREVAVAGRELHGARQLVLGAYHAPLAEGLDALVVAVGGVAARVDHREQPARVLEHHGTRVDVLGRHYLRDIQSYVSTNQLLQYLIQNRYTVF